MPVKRYERKATGPELAKKRRQSAMALAAQRSRMSSVHQDQSLADAASSILSYIGMDQFLASANDLDAFGITARDLRALREAMSLSSHD